MPISEPNSCVETLTRDASSASWLKKHAPTSVSAFGNAMTARSLPLSKRRLIPYTNMSCSACNLHPAEMFCACTLPETFLCRNCIIYHGRDTPGIPHAIQHLSLLPFYKIPGYFQRAKCRSDSFPQVRTVALESLQNMDRAIKEYREAVESMLLKIGRHSHDVLSQLEMMKADMSEAVKTALEEVERTIAEDQPVLQTRYGPALRQLAENCQPKPLFAYRVEKCSVPAEAVVTLSYALPQPQDLVVPSRFAAVFGSTVTLCDLVSGQTTQQALSKDFNNTGSVVQLDGNSVLCLGGQPLGVYLLDLTSFNLAELPALPTPRSYFGLAKAGENVYVFGGIDSYGNPLSICEKLSLVEKAWYRAGTMTHCRAAFTPCCHDSLLYLVSSWGPYPRAVETFNPATEMFQVLAVALPDELAYGCGVTFAVRGELCVLTEKQQIARWRVGEQGGFQVSVTDRACWSTQIPMISEGMAFINVEGMIYKFSFDSYTFVG